jgi:hypothetical protein
MAKDSNSAAVVALGVALHARVIGVVVGVTVAFL